MRRRWTKQELDKLEELTETMTFAEIAKMYGMKTSAIQMACNRHGIHGKQRNKELIGAAAPGYQRAMSEKKRDIPKEDPFMRRFR